MRQVLDGLGLEQAPALLEVALHGWVGFVESSSLRWLEVSPDDAPSVEDLVDLFSQLLTTTLEVNRSRR